MESHDCNLSNSMLTPQVSWLPSVWCVTITAFPLSHYANGFSHSPYGNSYIEWNRNYNIRIMRSHGNAVYK